MIILLYTVITLGTFSLMELVTWLTHKYLLGLRKAHKVHHKHLGKEKGECFGMLFVPKKYHNQYK